MALKIVFVTGGAKSGKSSFALTHASCVKGKKAFIATAEALDNEMKERIGRHKAERGDEWETYEVPLKVSDVLLDAAGKHSAIILDCLTIWLSNVLIGEVDTEKNIQDLVDNLIQIKESPVCSSGDGCSVLYIVSNEVGMGIVPENDLARKFRDLAGGLNQRIAEISDDAYLVVAGRPIKIN